jgi:hypothetical protein
MEKILVLLEKIPDAQLEAITNDIFRLLGGWDGTADIGIITKSPERSDRRISIQASTMESPDITSTCPQ